MLHHHGRVVAASGESSGHGHHGMGIDYGGTALLQAFPDLQKESEDRFGDPEEEATHFVPEFLSFGQLQELQITELCHVRDPLLSRIIHLKTAGAELCFSSGRPG